MVFVDDTEPATSQMTEFAIRTEQTTVPALARDFLPATRDPAAVLTRAELWRSGGEDWWRLVGLYWGPEVPDEDWRVRIGPSQEIPVSTCLARPSPWTWGLWEAWAQDLSGDLDVSLVLDNSPVPTRLLDRGYYTRTVRFDATR